MTLLLSTPDGFRLLGWRKFGIAALITWLLPAIVAGVALAVQWLLGTQSWGNGFLMLWALSVLVLFSPALSWFAIVVAVPLVWALMKRGWFGWIPALLIGMGFGVAFAFVVGNDAMVTFGAALIALLRAAIGRLCPPAVNNPSL
jgi:hypothetical protein